MVPDWVNSDLSQEEVREAIAGAWQIHVFAGCVSACWIQQWAWVNHRDTFYVLLFVWSILGAVAVWESFEPGSRDDEYWPAFISTVVTAVLLYQIPSNIGVWLLAIVSFSVRCTIGLALLRVRSAKVFCCMVPFFLAVLISAIM